MQRIHILMDSHQALKSLKTGVALSSLEDVRQFRTLAQQAQVLLTWIRGHSGIRGNEEADLVARTALRDLPSQHEQPEKITLAYLRRLLKQRRQTLLDGWWT